MFKRNTLKREGFGRPADCLSETALVFGGQMFPFDLSRAVEIITFA
jgi:hypothetical protein